MSLKALPCGIFSPWGTQTTIIIAIITEFYPIYSGRNDLITL